MIRSISRRTFLGRLSALTAGCASILKSRSAQSRQPGAPWRIGMVIISSAGDTADAQSFLEGLRELGYTEGLDVVIDWRYANGDYAPVSDIVADLIKRNVDVIVVETTLATAMAKRATAVIPIIMAAVADPVGSGLVASLARPSENVTGLSLMAVEIGAKRLQLFKEAIPGLRRIAVLWNPATPWHPRALSDLKAAAPGLSVQLSFVGAPTADRFIPAFSEFKRKNAQGLFILDDGIFFAHRTTLVNLSAQARLPASYSDRQFVAAGGLMAYGANVRDMYRRASRYADKILKGAKAGDLPIEQPTKFDLVFNLRTARNLGLTIPESVLRRASEVIR